MEEWRDYFAGLLGGVEERVVRREKSIEEESSSGEELGREEV